VDEPDTPLDSPLRMRDVMESPRYLDLWRAKLAPGDPAFDFELPLLETGKTVRLSSFTGEQPVALVFGSYT
jgi:hypothetical protein